MARVSTLNAEKERAGAWYGELFKSYENLPFSFRIGETAYHGFNDDFPFISKETSSERISKKHAEYEIRKMVLTARHKSGVEVKTECAYYPEYAAFEWVLHFKNTAEENSPVIRCVNAAELDFSGSEPVLEYFLGDDSADQKAMKPERVDLNTGLSMEFEPFGGRPTNYQLPFYRLYYGEIGVVISVGWAGQWKAHFDASHRIGSVHFSAGQATLEGYLKPGEEIRTPLMTFLAFNKCPGYQVTEMRALNLWRRWLIDCNLRVVGGELFQPHCAASTSWIYGEMKDATDQNQIEAFDTYLRNGLKLDYWWMDAGWYFKNPKGEVPISSWVETGSWYMDTNKFPSEMADISKHCAEHGAKTLLWFEPERITGDTYLAEHPEWLVNGALANMSDPELRAYLVERVSSVMEKGGIHLYRQDYNIDPLGHWVIHENNSGEGRHGFLENHCVTGYLAYWDALIEKYPDMMLDSCASGGRRNDLETMRRSVSLHKTDADYSRFQQKQAMHYSFYQWLPYFGTPVTGPGYGAELDLYALRSAHIPWFTYGYDVRNPENNYENARRFEKEWRETNMYFYGDYFPLTPWSNDLESWIGWEFKDYEKEEGIIQMFRRDNSPVAEMQVRLFDIDPDGTYEFFSYDGEPVKTVGGAELIEQGLNVRISEPRASALLKFCKIS